jgi:tetratricopeptide (TPR) repeat protein
LLVLFLQATIGLGTVYLTYLLGRRIFGPRLGKVACLITALHAPAIYCEGLIEKTTLSVFLFTFSLVFFLGRSKRDMILAGAALGLAALTRGNFLLFIPLGTVLLLRRDDGNGAAKSRASDSPPALAAPSKNAQAGLFLTASLVLVSIAILHNVGVAGAFATTTSLGQNLYIGNHSENQLGTYRPPAFVRPDPQHEEADFRAEAEKQLGRAVNPEELSRYWRNRALSETASNPGMAAERTLRKFRLFWHDFEVPDNSNIYTVRDESPVLSLHLVSMGILFPLALLGAVTAFRANHQVRLLVGVVAVYSLGVVAFFVLGRLRIQVMPMLAVLAAAGFARASTVLRSRIQKSMVSTAAILMVGLLICFTTPGWLEDLERSSNSISYNNIGVQYAEMGREDAAIEAYEKAVRIDNERPIAAMRQLGEIYLRRKNFARAETHMLHVLELKPGSRMGQDALIRLYEAMTRDSAYSGNTDVKRKLDDAYRRAGRSPSDPSAGTSRAP